MTAGSRLKRVAALAAVAVAAPGCIVAIGSHGGESSEQRVERLERRIAAAERRLGIDAAPTDAAPAPDAAKKDAK